MLCAHLCPSVLLLLLITLFIVPRSYLSSWSESVPFFMPPAPASLPCSWGTSSLCPCSSSRYHNHIPPPLNYGNEHGRCPACYPDLFLPPPTALIGNSSAPASRTLKRDFSERIQVMSVHYSAMGSHPLHICCEYKLNCNWLLYLNPSWSLLF